MMRFTKRRSTGQKRIIYEKQHHSHRMWVMLLLLYAMRLQYLHIGSRSIRIGIKKLFGENIAVE